MDQGNKGKATGCLGRVCVSFVLAHSGPEPTMAVYASAVSARPMREPTVAPGGGRWAQGHVPVQLPRTLVQVLRELRKRPLSLIMAEMIGL